MLPFKGMAVLIASSGRNVPIEWALSLPTFQYPMGMSISWILCKDTRRGEQRDALVQRALDMGAEWLMFIDDDTVIPNYAIQQLHYQLNQHPDVAVIGGIYCTKSEFPEPLVFQELGGGPFWDWKLGEIFECKGIGAGCMMVRSSAIKDIPKPWFRDTNDAPIGVIENHNGVEAASIGNGFTDDLFFCKKVIESGWKILAHGGVLPVHIGQDGKEYSLPIDSYPCREYKKQLEEAIATGKKEIVIPEVQ